MKVAVIADLMTAGDELLDDLRISLGAMAGDEPGRADIRLAEQREQTLGADAAELAARNCAQRGGAESSEPQRDRVEVEGETDGDFFLHHDDSRFQDCLSRASTSTFSRRSCNFLFSSRSLPIS